MDELIILDTPEKIYGAQFLARKSALRLEIMGLKRSGGRTVYSICKSVYHLKGSRQSVLDQMEAMWQKYTEDH